MKAGAVVKRKTPSKLRGEQLKRRIVAEVAHESSVSLEPREVDSEAWGHTEYKICGHPSR